MFENWESEFLQTAVFVVLTKFLRQKGSSESKRLDEHEEVDEEPKKQSPGAPWPVRKGGIVLALYQRSMSLALLILFGISFVLHAVGGASKHNEDLLRHGRPPMSTLAYAGSSQFWFESFRTGRASSSPSPCWCFCRSSFASEALRSRNTSLPPMRRRATDP